MGTTRIRSGPRWTDLSHWMVGNKFSNIAKFIIVQSSIQRQALPFSRYRPFYTRMPCGLYECSYTYETMRFTVSLVGMYIYHYLSDTLLIRPLLRMLVRHNIIPEGKRHKGEQFRESCWKNIAVGTFFTLGLYIGYNETWFMNSSEYFKDFPWPAPEPLRWYYAIYAAYWVQSIDFLFNLSAIHYDIVRKDLVEMIIHHIATLGLMGFSYALEFTRMGLCVLMIHDVNDLLLETAKIFLYTKYQLLSDITFGLFAIVWYALRWYFFTVNIVASVYHYGYTDFVLKSMEGDGLDIAGVVLSSTFCYSVWFVNVSFLATLLLLHVYWGTLIGKMVIKALAEGSVDKDIRSDSEDEDEEEKTKSKTEVKKNTTTKRRKRAPKAE